MKVRGAVAAALASAGILLAGWQAGTQVGGISTVASSTTAAGTTGSTGTGSSGTSSSGLGSTGTGSAATGSSGTRSSGSSNSSASGTYTGTAVQTRFGTVQVQITVSNGKITEVTPLQLTDTDGRSIQISNRAAPLLRSKVLAAESANVQTVSGATITSRAYLSSLQAAIDAANL